MKVLLLVILAVAVRSFTIQVTEDTPNDVTWPFVGCNADAIKITNLTLTAQPSKGKNTTAHIVRSSPRRWEQLSLPSAWRKSMLDWHLMLAQSMLSSCHGPLSLLREHQWATTTPSSCQTTTEQYMLANLGKIHVHCFVYRRKGWSCWMHALQLQPLIYMRFV